MPSLPGCLLKSRSPPSKSLGAVAFAAGLLSFSLGVWAKSPALQPVHLSVNFSVDPALSNWTWVPPADQSPTSNSFAWVATAPSAFGLAGFLEASITGCSADRFNNNVTQASILQSHLARPGAPLSPSLSVLSSGVGNVSAAGPAFNLTTGQPFNVEQKYGGFGAWWSAPSATWTNVTGYINSGRGFRGGPIANANLSSPIASFGQGSGFLTTMPC